MRDLDRQSETERKHKCSTTQVLAVDCSEWWWETRFGSRTKSSREELARCVAFSHSLPVKPFISSAS
eukprot:3349454-Pyramimonas_sp.AAC.1